MTPVLQSAIDIGEEQGAAVAARPAAGPLGPGRYGRLVPRTGLRRPLVRYRRSAPAEFRRVRSTRLDEPALDDAVFENVNLDGALLRLDHGDDVAALDPVARPFEPFDQVPASMSAPSQGMRNSPISRPM
jgi:hypothetical protein